ncbi:MAG: hypothetical protein K6G88_10635 [Lachnospiraceae bacterium]|nr:hypothetical protein [Lachnospiraceae bacterium]
MTEMYGVKQLLEKGNYLTVNEIKKYAKAHDLMDEDGKITQKGEEHISYKYTKFDRFKYIAITEELAIKIRDEKYERVKDKYNGIINKNQLE